MKIYKIPVGFLATNCYLMEKNGNGLLVDPGDEFEKLQQIITEKNLTLKAILLTHGHFDHMGAVKSFQSLGVKVFGSEKDETFLKNPRSVNFAVNATPCTLDEKISSGTLTLAGMEIETIETPGHSKGSLVFKIHDHLFTGDTLFKEGVGRCDLEGGDFSQMLNSLEKLKKLNCHVHPGHGEESHMSFELKFNPYLKDGSNDF